MRELIVLLFFYVNAQVREPEFRLPEEDERETSESWDLEPVVQGIGRTISFYLTF